MSEQRRRRREGLSVAIAFDAMAIELPAECEVGADEADAVAAVGAAIDDVEGALRAAGHRPRRLPLAADPAALARTLAALECDVIFNLAESYGGQAAREAEIATRLAATGVPLTGSPPDVLGTCLDKGATRAALGGVVPVPAAALITHADAPLPPLPWPCILKPAAQDASHGIAFASVCADASSARTRARHLFERGLGPVLVEAYIDGRELNVSVLEDAGDGTLVVLPPAEIAFERWPADAPRILTYAAKWDPDSLEYQQSVSRRVASPEPEAEAIARRVFAHLGLRGYGRIDLRVDARGPFVIDVNPNPDLSLGAGFQLAAERAGRSYASVVDAIVQSALP